MSSETNKEASMHIQCYDDACQQSTQSAKRCSRCKTVAYCSRVCQKRQWSSHKHFCHALLSERLQAICQYVINQACSPINLSCEQYIFNEDGIVPLCAYEASNDRTGSLWCAICEASIYTKSTVRYTVDVLDIIYKDISWEYYRCFSCEKHDRLLCGRTLMANDECHALVREKLLFIVHASHEMALHVTKDVTLLILQLLISLTPCCTGCQ